MLGSLNEIISITCALQGKKRKEKEKWLKVTATQSVYNHLKKMNVMLTIFLI